MVDWGKRHLETVLGKTVTGIIGVFILGGIAMWALPKILVTHDALANALTKVRDEVAQVQEVQKSRDTSQALEIARLRIDNLKQQQFVLLDKRANQGTLSPLENQRLEEIDRELKKLYAREDELEKELNK